MKTLVSIVNEKLSINRDTPLTPIEKIEMALPELENEIKKEVGINKSFNLGLKVKSSKDRKGVETFEIESENLVDLTGPIGQFFYEYFIFGTWGGKPIDGAPETIWFNPKWFFKYKKGGSNGNDAIWDSLLFNLETGEWEFRKPNW